ncbi:MULTISPECIES: 16S rRNA (guanine(966)-N(2))-methyltransferase RsmD [Brevundimonas]|uniref:16S rRNA (guanine(966)-N(2))-methyltransferase RsmD n=1 Tax=Brevundimonas sp. ZS04 TaxID=1906854 RepID=UPI00096E1FA9|nr:MULTISPECIES: 16S rRNA (guanine(966)-N(2))-methyltransferase RsmD [Brevundimonas]OMG60797.1 16S rRNA (guanine(966)-N(2))-methyltransferase RsmD [Brevundimonas sp. ZS04]
MRIVAGQYRGRAIVTPEGQNTRPTSDRARQAIFNVLEHAPWAEGLHEARVIDLYAGSGALGFEALSRGAAFCLFVDTDDGARGAIRENMDAYGLFGRCRVHRRSATDLGPRPGSAGEAFTLAFLDPPYAKGLGEQTLARLLEGGWLAPGAIVVFERGSDEPEIDPPGYERLDARDYGAARVLFLRASEASA